ncbi:MAG: DUF4012 domain-containing protein [Candidatus Moranbacteria bacterium]|nr:DUF4012 domain-containing protein [Candidatus Moranbacteria bacterium]
MKKRKQKNNVIPQMFDVRPVNERGDFDAEKYIGLPEKIRIESKQEFKQRESGFREAKPGAPIDDIWKNPSREFFEVNKLAERRLEEKKRREEITRQRIREEEKKLEEQRKKREDFLKRQKERKEKENEKKAEERLLNSIREKYGLSQEASAKYVPLDDILKNKPASQQVSLRNSSKEERHQWILEQIREEKRQLRQTRERRDSFLASREAEKKKKLERKAGLMESKRRPRPAEPAESEGLKPEKKDNLREIERKSQEKKIQERIASLKNEIKKTRHYYLGCKISEELPLYHIIPPERTENAKQKSLKEIISLFEQKQTDPGLNIFGQKQAAKNEERLHFYREKLRRLEKEEEERWERARRAREQKEMERRRLLKEREKEREKQKREQEELAIQRKKEEEKQKREQEKLILQRRRQEQEKEKERQKKQEELQKQRQREERERQKQLERKKRKQEKLALQRQKEEEKKRKAEQKEWQKLKKMEAKEEARRQKEKEKAYRRNQKELKSRQVAASWKNMRQALSAAPGRVFGTSFWKPAFSFGCVCLVIFLIVLSGRFASYGFQLKDDVEVKGQQASRHIAKAKEEFENKNIDRAILNLNQAKKEIKEANQRINKLGGNMMEAFSHVPFLSKIGSGKKLMNAGEELMEAASLLGGTVEKISKIENPLESQEGNKQGIGDVFLHINEDLAEAGKHLKKANHNLQEVNPGDVPERYRDEFKKGKEFLPQAIAYIEELNKNQFVFKDLLGYNGPRKYLFLFQNNQEMRATGGFIGSYGVLDVHEGHVEELFIDGIFNPDGQLDVNVIPPKPIQKISAAWSTHDSNWFPNFPTSAEKISWFYEKTGGPTVDGVITFTPDVVKKLLEITGPIEMPEYDTTLTAENFVDKTQFKVEFDYDKEENKPKKIIADMAPKLLDKVFAKRDLEGIAETLNVFSEALDQKHILVYSRNHEIQNLVSQLGWSGEVLDTKKDYLMVVNSNINGFKTDGVIDQKIDHNAEIKPDGSIVDTVTITRKHNGGNSEYEFYNKVNANYMRVYVPEGSKLLDVQGHTREFNSAPLDYEKLKFQKDSQVAQLEQSMEIDQETGTRIYRAENKTVFGNWVYVSPQEEVKVTYKYRLPFKVDVDKNKDKTDYYSLLAQKQSGSAETEFSSSISKPDNFDLFWKYPEEIEAKPDNLKLNSNLEVDRFIGTVFRKKGAED